MAKATKLQVKRWLMGIRARMGMKEDIRDAEAAVALSQEAFIARFPAASFCESSMDAVAGSERFWNEAALIKALTIWQVLNEPSSTLPPEAENAPVSTPAKHWLARFYRARDDDEAERALDLIRSLNEEAFTYLVQHDTRAANIAVWRKWMPPTRADLAADWDDEEKVRAMVRKILAYPRDPSRYRESLFLIVFNAFVQVIKVNAPQHGPAMFDEMRWIAGGGIDATEPATIVPPEPSEFNLFGDLS